MSQSSTGLVAQLLSDNVMKRLEWVSSAVTSCQTPPVPVVEFTLRSE